MRITSTLLRDTYISLCKCHPFNKWDMPPAELCQFIVNNDDDAMGTYIHNDEKEFPHRITVSRKRVSFYTTLVATLAHEMIHASRWRGNWDKHDNMFRKRAAQISKEFGSFDPLEL